MMLQCSKTEKTIVEAAVEIVALREITAELIHEMLNLTNYEGNLVKTTLGLCLTQI